MKRLICYLLWRFHDLDAALFVIDGGGEMNLFSFADAVVHVHYGRTWVTWWEVSREPWELWIHRVPARLVTEARRTW
jgi:hypothetical protein